MVNQIEKAVTKTIRSISGWMKGLILPDTNWIQSTGFAIAGSLKNENLEF
jgi:hypothetical protein